MNALINEPWFPFAVIAVFVGVALLAGRVGRWEAERRNVVARDEEEDK